MHSVPINYIIWFAPSSWDTVYLAWDPSLNRIGCAAVGVAGTFVSPLFCAWGDVAGESRGEKIYKLGEKVRDVFNLTSRSFRSDKIVVLVEKSFMSGDSDAFRTLIMAEGAIRRELETVADEFVTVSNSTWKSKILGKASVVGKKSWEKEDIERIIGQKYNVSIPSICRGFFSRGPNKGKKKEEHNDAWDALGLALYAAGEITHGR